MEISLEMVERLKEKADVSYSQAKADLFGGEGGDPPGRGRLLFNQKRNTAPACGTVAGSPAGQVQTEDRKAP